MAKQSESLEQLIRDLVDVKREYAKLRFDEEARMTLGKPASPKQIAKLEQRLGEQLPPSYRAFLELHNGWEGFEGGSQLLSVEDQDADWVKDRLKTFVGMAFRQAKVENPFEHGAIPILLGEDDVDFLLLDPRKVRKGGEMDFVKYTYGQEDHRFKDFTSFLRHDLKVERECLENEKHGSPDDEDED